MSARRGSRLGAVGALLALVATLFVTALPAAQAAITITNGGFETGLSGWTATTNAQAIGTDGAVVPRQGSRMAKMTAGSVDVWYSVSQSFTAGAGESVGGWAYFQAGDYMPYDDTGEVVVQQGATVVATPFRSSVSQVGNYGGSLWKRWRHTFASAGTYTVVARVRNDRDGALHSFLYVDKIGQVFDNTAPVVEPVITGTLGTNGWYTSDVALTWSVTDAESVVDGTFGCASATITADTGGQSYSCSAWSEGGETNRTVTIKRDATTPTLSFGAPSPAAAGGWNNTDVSIPYAAADNLSGVASASPSSPVVVAVESSPVTRDVTITDIAGNSRTYTTPALSIDKTAPSITGARLPAANPYGWNNTDVTVSFTCDDSLSGIASCSGPTTLSAPGAAQAVTGTAADNAGNAASATVADVGIDKQAPGLTGTPTTSANANGWYNTDVLIGWSAVDDLSGVEPSAVPPTSLLTSEGTAQTAGASVADRAGNVTTAASAPVDIDKTAPTTSASAPGGWVNGAATVALAPADGLSGVDATFYSVDGGPTQSGTTVAITSEGRHTVRFWSTDMAGNVEAPNEVSVDIDTTAPTISAVQTPAKNANGWNNAAVTVSFVCGDSLSGIASCTAPVFTNLPGEDQPATGTAVDNAGNSSSTTAFVSIDVAAPTVTATRLPAGPGWVNVPVDVAFACADDLSGVASCADAVTLGHGADQAVSGDGVDAADNVGTAGVTDVDVDLHAPSITGAPTTAANAHGWYASAPSVAFACADDLSGVIACSPDATVLGEGADLSATGSAVDAAGNTATAVVGGMNVDMTAPTVTATPDRAPDANGWFRAPVMFTYHCTDALSGVLTCPAPKTFAESGADLGATASATDKAGHTTAYAITGVNVDLGAPTIVGEVVEDGNAAGWHRGDVTVRFTCADDLSGVASCPADVVVSTEGENQAVTGEAVDAAGNTATTTVSGINIDKTAPGITGGPDRAANGAGWYDAPVVVSFSCTDALSGTEACTAPVTVADDGAGITVQGEATDRAGNSARFDVSGINLDQVAPSLSGVPTSAANAHGWYGGDVVVAWTADDDLSGIDPATVPAESVVGGEGAGLSASASVADLAGNVTSVTSAAVNIDRTAPVTIASSPSAWVNGAATVTLSASDGLSGVDATSYVLDGEPVAIGTEVEIASEGVHTVRFWSVDKAGNQEAEQQVTVRVDLTAPTITHTQTPEKNAAGWNNTDVEVTFLCGDNLSGVASCSDPHTFSAEAALQTVVGTATDQAGNSAEDTASVSIDKTAPTISASRSPLPNGFGWANTDVTVTFTCDDDRSGVAACADTQVFGEGTGLAATGVAVDNAGNAASTELGGVNVDKTAPIITGAVTTLPNADGWYNAAVTVTFTCADERSGIVACPDDVVLDGDGADQSVTRTVEDRAGNRSTVTVSGIDIDRTAPAIAGAPTTSPNVRGWYRTAVTVHFTCSDATSGVGDRCPADVVLDGDGADQSVTRSVTDLAGNSASATVADLDIDRTAPVVTWTGNAGTYTVDQTVGIACTAADALSGIHVHSCEHVSGPAWSFAVGQTTRTATAEDGAGNTTTAGTTFSVLVTFDSLAALTAQFSDSAGIADALSSKLAAAEDAHARGNTTATAGQLKAYANQVAAQKGKALSPAEADVLTALVGRL